MRIALYEEGEGPSLREVALLFVLIELHNLPHLVLDAHRV